MGNRSKQWKYKHGDYLPSTKELGNEIMTQAVPEAARTYFEFIANHVLPELKLPAGFAALDTKAQAMLVRDVLDAQKLNLMMAEKLVLRALPAADDGGLARQLAAESQGEVLEQIFGSDFYKQLCAGLECGMDRGLEPLEHYTIYRRLCYEVALDSEAAKKKRLGLKWSLAGLRRLRTSLLLNPYAWWQPTGAHEALMREMSRIGRADLDSPMVYNNILVCGANATIKTTFEICGVILPFLLPLELARTNDWVANWPFWKEQKRWTNILDPAQRMMGVMLHHDAVETVLKETLKRWAPYDSWEPLARGGKSYDWLIQFKHGGRLVIFTSDTKLQQQRGPSMFAWVTSETFDIRKWAEMAARLRGWGFMFHEFCPEYDKEGQYLYNAFMAMRADQRILMEWDKSTACYDHGIRGTRSHGVILEEIKQIPAPLFAPKVQGKPAYAQGRVFPEWKPELYCLPEEKAVAMVRELGGTLYTATDPHPTRANFLVLGFILGNGHKIFVDEWPTFEEGCLMPRHEDWFSNAMAPLPTYFHLLADGTDFANDGDKFCRVLAQKISGILQRYRGDGIVGKRVYPECVMNYVDPRPANTKSVQTGISYKGYLNEVGSLYNLTFEAASVEKEIEHRVQRIRQEMAEGAFWVSQRCKNLAYVLEQIFYMPQVIRGAYTNKLSRELDEDMKNILDAAFYFEQKADPLNPRMVHIPPPEVKSEPIRPRYESRPLVQLGVM